MSEEKITIPRASELSAFSCVSEYRTQLMGLAALWILCFHEWVPVLGNVPVLGWVEGFIKNTGFCGVDMFFFLSGMGLPFAIAKSSLGQFYYKRLRRLAIPFLVIATVRMLTEQWLFGNYLKAITGYSFYTSNMYTLLWFVPAIASFYLVFPLYYRFMSRSNNPYLFTATVLVIWLLLSNVLDGHLREDLYGFTNRIPIFLLGILFGWAGKNGKSFTYKASHIVFLFSLLALGIYLSYRSNYIGVYILVPVSNCCIPNALMSSSLCCLISLGLKKLSGTFIRGRVLKFFGLFTLEFYCVQEWLAGRILNSILEMTTPFLANILFLLFVILFAYALYWINLGFWKLVDLLVGLLPKKERA